METIKTKSKDYGNISVIIKDNSQVSIVSSKGNEIVNGFVFKWLYY
jgi:hypothetical protein